MLHLIKDPKSELLCFFSSATIALEVFAAARWNTLNVGHVSAQF